MRTGVSVLGCVSPEGRPNHPGARDIADKLMYPPRLMLKLVPLFVHNGRAIDVETDDDSIGNPPLHLLYGARRELGARCTPSLILYAEQVQYRPSPRG